MSHPHATRLVRRLSIVTVVMLAQAVMPVSTHSLLWGMVLNTGHFPLFGLFALVVLWLSISTMGWTGPPRLRAYLLAFAAAAFVGALTEAVQMLVPRDASWMDLAHDLMGAATALLVALSFDRKLRDVLPRNRLLRPGMLLAAVALTVVVAAPVTTIAIAYHERDAAFPTICDFQHSWQLRFIVLRDATLEVTDAPEAWGKPAGDRVGRITFAHALYPAFALREPYPDWTSYDRLTFTVYCPADTTIDLFLRVDDAHHDDRYTDRFNRALRIEAGANRIVIPLLDVRNGPANREMDMTRIRSLALFAGRPHRPLTVYVDDFRLERD